MSATFLLLLAAVLAPTAGGVSHAAVAKQTGTARVTATHALLAGRWDVLADVLETVEEVAA